MLYVRLLLTFYALFLLYHKRRDINTKLYEIFYILKTQTMRTYYYEIRAL